MPVPGNRPSRAGAGLRRHAGIDVVDQRAEGRVDAVARLRQVHLDLGDDAAGIGGEHQDAVAHQHRFLDIVRDQQDAADRHAAFAPEVEKVGAQRFGGEHVERGERLVHQQQLGIDHQRAREADALAHAARQLLRVGVFEPVEADQVDGGQRPLAALLRRHALRFQPQLDVLLDREPGEQREALEHHGKSVGGAFDRLAVDCRLRRSLGRHQPRDDAQKRGLARAGAAQQRDNLVVVHGQVDIVEHEQIAARAALVEVPHLLDGDQRGRRRVGLRCNRTHRLLPVQSMRRRRSASA